MGAESKSLFAETHMSRSSRPKTSSALPPHIAKASRELDAKQVLVLDDKGRAGFLARQTQWVEKLWGAVQVMEDDNAFIQAIANAFSGRAIGLMPASISEATLDRLLMLESVKKWLALYIAWDKKRRDGITSLGDGKLSDLIVAKVRKLVK